MNQPEIVITLHQHLAHLKRNQYIVICITSNIFHYLIDSDSNNLASSPEKSGNDTFLEASFHPDTSKILLEKSNKSFHSENFTQLSNEFKKSQNSQFKSFEKLCVKYQDLYQKYVDNLKIIDNLKKQEMNVKNKEKIEHATSKSSLHKKETDLSKSKIENNKELCSELEKSKKTIAILKNEVSYYRNEAKKYQKESELLGEEVITIRTEYSKSKNDTERQRQGSHSNRLYESKKINTITN